ncbi:CASP-like protein 1F1 [Raphanus sativus]|uniref:CASP-like protein n=1 Tax=Raphanus sativus TaxID=3726 RepID=A0A6J0KPK3_RAPSA|nr:CASP-like protein 1F1 [Raphanus sativus]XP_056853560.1 CASP-like protein 1F1 [Raphanus sativus]KAJ4871260.1 CASP-like protein 1F1 [Raphanus sativus]KAJ4873082.1 CASP-like protein 1F1 [Raphanus sativus]
MGDNEGKRTLMNLKVQVSMRVLTVGAALASMGLMITNREVASVYGIAFEAKYSDSSAFRYLVYAYIAIAAVTLFTLAWACLAVRRGGFIFALFVIDLLMALTALSAFSASMSEGYIGKYGNTHAGWLPICGYVHNYCNRVTLSLAFSFVSFLLLFILTVLTASAARRS